MIYFSSMSLKEFIDTNYTELPQELLDLWKLTSAEIEDLEDRAANAENIAEDIRYDVERLIENIQAVSVSYYTNQVTADEFAKAVTELCDEANIG